MESRISKLWLGLLSLGIALLNVQSVQAASNSVAVDFNAAGELTGLFDDGYATPSWSQNLTNGIAGSGGITIPEGSSDLYISQQGFPMQAGATYTVGAYYFNEYDAGYGGLGFTTLASGTMNGGAATPLSAIGVSFHGGGGLMDNNTDTASSSTSVDWNISLETVGPGWFYFQETLIVTSPNTFSQTFKIWQCDTNGNLGTNFTSTTVTGQINPSLGAATFLYPFFGASGYRFIAADNFTATSTTTGIPFIIVPPSNQMVTPGSNVRFTVTAVGTGPLSYQWQFNDADIEGAAGTNYDLTGVTSNDAGNYTVVVSNASGSVTSSVATLTLLLPSPPVITSQPIGQTVAEGTPVDLSITATGDELNCQWLKDGRFIIGATNGTLTLAAAAIPDSGVYFAVVMNPGGVAISQPVTVMVGNPQLLAWGDNFFGELGDGTQSSYPPNDLPEIIATNVVTAAAGDYHSLFVKNDGTLWTMGENFMGQLGDGTWYQHDVPECVASNVVSVAAGCEHSLFLKSDGTLWGMGDNGFGELGGGFGFEWWSPGLVASNVVAVAADAWGSLYIQSDGTLWGIGGNRNGELGNGSTTSPIASNVVAVAAGAFHTLYLTGDGTLWAMGANADGELGDGTTNDVSVPAAIASSVVAIAAGNNFSLFVKNDGTLWAMGANGSGQLGDGTTISRFLPVCVASNVVSVTAGISFSLFLTSDGTTWGMGDNREGQLGDGTTTQQNSPEAITSVSLANVVSGSMADHTLAVGISLAPVITSQPVSQTVLEGTPVTFTVTATDAGPITYQWQNYGFDIEGATNATYSIASPSWSDGGWYTVVVTGIRGVAVSQTADLTVTNIPVPMATITLAADPLEGGFVNGGGMLPIGGGAMLMAMPSPGWLFVNWSDGSTNNPYNILVPDTDTNYTAYFAPAAILMLYASPEEGGFVTGTGTFAIGSTNPITAVASNGWAFVQWSDGSTNNPENIVVTSNLEFTASFAPATTVTTVAAPSIAGSTSGDGSYAIGSNAILTATPSNGWAFVNWNGTVTNNPWTFLVPSNPAVCTASFAPVSTVTALANPTNAGSVSGGGIIFVGSNTLLTATASNNWRFIQWNDGVTNNVRVVTAPATNITYTADFAATATITVLASPSTAGTVSGGGTFLVGSTNPITATATNGWIFTGWSDGTTSSSESVVATSNRIFTANFAPTATVTILMNPTNAGAVVTGGGVYRIGSAATLTASIPTLSNQNQWIFLNWNGTVTNYTRTGNTNNPLGFTVTTNITVTANFAQVTSAGLVYTHIWVKPQIIIQLNSSKAKTRFTPESTTLVQEIEIVGYVGYVPTVVISGGPPFTVTVPAEIDGVPVGEIGPEALTGAGKIDVLELDIDDAVSTYTLDGTCAEVADLEFAGNMAELDALLAAGELFVAADAVVDCSEVGVAAGLSGAALGILGGIFSSIIDDLAIVYVDASPSNGGSVSGGGLYVHGWPVTLTANPNRGWRFSGWGDGGSGAGTTNRLRTVYAGTQTAPYTANFTQQSTVTVVAAPTNEAGVVTGEGTYDVGTRVPLTATAEEGWEFHNWSDGSIEETNEIEVPDHDVTYTATFYVEVEGEAEPPTGGIIVGNSSYPEGSPVLLTAISNPGWEFKGWFLEALSTNSTLLTNITTVVVAAEPVPMPLKYKAHFDQILQVTGLASPTNAGSVDGSGTYEVDDTNITLTATASNNWAFVKWDDGTTNNSITITVPPTIVMFDIYTNIVRTAYFAATANITVVTNPISGGFVSGGGTFLVGSTNPIVAVASNGWAFTGWNDGNSNSLRFIVVTSNQTYTANFAPVSTVTGLANPTNAGIVTGGAVYFVGSNAVLTAISTNTWRFTQWNDGATNNPYSITVPGTNITYIANFAATAIITVGAQPTNGGAVTGGGTCLVGSTNLITASATNGWLFVGWNDGATTNHYYITVPATNNTYTAEFTAGNSTNITTSISGKTLTLAWPADHLGWILQALTNDLSSTNWFDLPGTGGTNSVVIPMNPANAAVFYRLRQP